MSIDAQLASLREWAQQNGHEIVGEYVDAGVSGKKPYPKRPELSRFMSDLENGLQCDCLLMTKLDRFYRSVRLYYQAVDVLEKHGVAWKAVHEDYETVTASGRLKVNIMLAVAEDEADRTAERIKSVFEHKYQKGEVVNNSIPIGYKVENKHLVIDEPKAEIVRGFFENYKKTGSIHSCMDYLHKHGITLHANSVSRMIRNPIYKGQHRGNPNYCPAIIPPEEWNEIQDRIKRRSIRKNQTGRIYLFSGLIKCGECGHAMSGITNNGKYPSYRCTNASMNKRCRNTHYVNETKLEKELLASVMESFTSFEIEYKKPKNHDKERKELKGRLERLKELYLDGMLSKTRFHEEYNAINNRLSTLDALSASPLRLERTKRIINDDIPSIYETLSRAEKRGLWQSIIEKIVAPENWESEGIQVFFRS